MWWWSREGHNRTYIYNIFMVLISVWCWMCGINIKEIKIWECWVIFVFSRHRIYQQRKKTMWNYFIMIRHAKCDWSDLELDRGGLSFTYMCLVCTHMISLEWNVRITSHFFVNDMGRKRNLFHKGRFSSSHDEYHILILKSTIHNELQLQIKLLPQCNVVRQP